MQGPNQVQTIRERLLNIPADQCEPTRAEVEAEVRRCAPHIFEVRNSTGLDHSGLRHMQAAMQEAEDRLLIARGRKPKFSIE